jgi:hypothetical protein
VSSSNDSPAEQKQPGRGKGTGMGTATQGPAFRRSLLTRLPRLEASGPTGPTAGPADLDLSSIIDLEADAFIGPLVGIAPQIDGWDSK